MAEIPPPAELVVGPLGSRGNVQFPILVKIHHNDGVRVRPLVLQQVSFPTRLARIAGFSYHISFPDPLPQAVPTMSIS